MKKIEEIEKHLPPKQKTLLYALRANNWKVIEIDNNYSDWAYDGKWVVESTRQAKGFSLQLWFFKYDGFYDGMNCVSVTNIDSTNPGPYLGEGDISIDFDGRRFEIQLSNFLYQIHNLRCTKNTK